MASDTNSETGNVKLKLKTKLFLVIALLMLCTVALIGFLVNTFIENQFKAYITKEKEEKTQEIVSILSMLYQNDADTWDQQAIHAVGMSMLYDGYIIKIYDRQNRTVWNAQAHDMTQCAHMMEEISQRMASKYPQIDGGFSSKIFHLTKDSEIVGSVSITYYGPFFLDTNDFAFIDTLNKILYGIGAFSLAISAAAGILLARKLSSPILKTADAARLISDGNTKIRISEKTDTQELNLLISSINHLAETLEKQEAIRKKLTEDVSHELRTPIGILQLQLEAMLDGVWEPSPERLTTCRDEIARMGKLVSDIEKLTKADQDVLNLDKQETDLLELVQKALKPFRAEIESKNLHVSLQGGSAVIPLDQDKIYQALFNLLSNAVKYTEDNGTISIEILKTPRFVVLRITDDGIGVAENELPFIFERFYRTDKSRSRHTGGAGIGLAIVKSIVEAHGGKVSVESQPNAGSCFEVALPRSSALQSR